uniref:Uncharacterized protein n=1 Tax=Tanacetum cinerariifolium TaxID=118510 RepID=A0A6L2KPS4_TANCI|nr:hypothetical protein [Tanacetum cinerariifolium]
MTESPLVDSRTPVVRPRDQDDPHDDAHPEGEKSAKRQKTSEYKTYVFGESSSGYDNKHEQGSSTSGNSCITISKKDHTFCSKLQRDPEATTLSLINQDLLYLKKGNSRIEKIVLSLHKFPAVVFNDDDIEKRTSRWVNKCVKKFNPYARYGVEHWKNHHAKIFYIRKQKEPGKLKEVIYSNSNIVQVIKTYWELDHEPKFITEIITGRANDCIINWLVFPSGYEEVKARKRYQAFSVNLYQISGIPCVHDMAGYMDMNMNPDLGVNEWYSQRIEEFEMFSIIYDPVHGIIYKNSKKEKRVMRHSEIHKFCDATLNRVLEGLKSYNNDVKYGYIQRDLTKDESTPIDFLAFVMNRHGLTTLTREVLVGHVFNFLKGYDHLDMDKPLPLIEKEGIESYQQKLNLLKPQRTYPDITSKELYTPNYDPRGVIYEDKQKEKRLVRLDELHKFNDNTLQSMHKTLHTRLQNLSLRFNPKSDMPNRAWIKKDQECTVTILKKIDVVLLKRRIMRSLEVLVGERKT